MSMKRTRSGCLPCRNRRRKCDGVRPRCKNCDLRGSTCQWGLKASFHPSRSLSLSRLDSGALVAIEARRLRQSRRPIVPFAIIDETDEITRDYVVLDSDKSPLPSSRQFLCEGANDVELSAATVACAPEPAAHNNGIDDASGLGIPDIPQRDSHGPSPEHPPQRAGSLTIADILQPHHSPLTPSPCPDGAPSELVTHLPTSWPDSSTLSLSFSLSSTGSATRLPEPVLPVSSTERIRLISLYIQETGTWCETTGLDRHLTVRSIHEMMKSTAFAAAAMSLASRQLDYVPRQERPVILELYQYTIQLLLRRDLVAPDAALFAACTLLCVYEMMGSEVHEWRRHLNGCAGLLQSQKWYGASQGIIKSCFWAFARIDVWAAFIAGKTTLIPTDFWLDDTAISSVRAKGTVDDYCNLTIFIFAKIVNLLSLAGADDAEYGPTFGHSLSGLWDDLQEWYQERPPEVRPLLRVESSSSKVFPTIPLSQPSPICGNTFYHAGCILLLQTLMSLAKQAPYASLADTDNIFWHARELAGISISNTSHSNWVNQLQPLYIVGTVFANSSRSTKPSSAAPFNPPPLSSIPLRFSKPSCEAEYPPSMGIQAITQGVASDSSAEKILLLKHLALIERETGWKTYDRAAALRELWVLG
ncbi:hypothetical protein BJY04DRAFT_208417 [Aspergillus karnatakaensis]|uniref:Zn(II)2Cys6 transcription factor n=1 Tax=Aspergillus karnatakaensis TaxID=1810916 RepID=UPI003CCD4DB0